MKNKEWSKDGNKMLINTSHKTFDKQTNCIATGNVIANTQVSFYIRAYNTPTTPMGQPAEPGAMQKWDLDGFKLPPYVRGSVAIHAVDKKVILYRFRHFSKNKEVIHGWVVTDENYNLLYKCVIGPTYKSWNIVEECIKYITNETEGEHV